MNIVDTQEAFQVISDWMCRTNNRLCALESKVENFTSTNKPSVKPCVWCRGRIANKGIFANYCPLCGFDLRTASHVG